jgi:hypothetical protein
LLLNGWQISGVYRWSGGRPYTVGYSIPGIGNANLTGNDGNPGDHTITNLPYDSSGNLIRNNGFGSINGVANPRTLQLVTRLTF